mmetsp:Transcript_36863/g.85012  ORF Transcript_36863/g.85012 Transcript_36863/m.85012 type:complete len:471 (-) Transcript_36863:211-1623(-)
MALNAAPVTIFQRESQSSVGHRILAAVDQPHSAGLERSAGRGSRAHVLASGLPVLALAGRQAKRRHQHGRRNSLTAVLCRSNSSSSSGSSSSSSSSGPVSERPVLDQLVTSGVKKLEELELGRVKVMSEEPSAENEGWAGEPREWADRNSMTQLVSGISQVGPLAAFKQFVADRLAGDYDKEAIADLINSKIDSNKVMMFSFSTCPFCLRAKTLLQEKYGVEVEAYECDLEPDGNAVRAELGRMTGRTSMPSTWLGPEVQLGGCNDGGLGGVATLDEGGQLRKLLEDRGVLEQAWWQAVFPADDGERYQVKEVLERECSKAPKNGVDASKDVRDSVETAVAHLEQYCPYKPATLPITGSWELLYCAAPGSSNGRVGPFIGDVTQIVRNDKDFVNVVELFGGVVRIALSAERAVLDDNTFNVTFKELSVNIFGQELMRRPLQGEGQWKQRYVDETLRVMNTPSIFVLKRRL